MNVKHVPKNVLVTGGAGFIGANFVRFIASKTNYNIVVLDALTYAGNYNTIKSIIESNQCKFIRGDILDTELVSNILNEYSIDTIVNFAAESHVDRSIENGLEFVKTNVLGTFNLLQVAKSYWLDKKNNKDNHRFHHISTDEVYGTLERNEPAFSETNRFQPNSPYAASKASSDHFIRAFNETYGLNVTISNCSNNYGPYHFPEKLIPLTVTNILHGKNIPVYGDGMQVRDWLHVEDHCRAIELILLQGESGEVFNVGGNNQWQNIDIVNEICRLINEQFEIYPSLLTKYPLAKLAASNKSQSLITYVADRLGHDRRYAVDYSKLSRKLNYEPNFTFSSGLKSTVEWYIENNDWWTPLKSI